MSYCDRCCFAFSLIMSISSCFSSVVLFSAARNIFAGVRVIFSVFDVCIYVSFFVLSEMYFVWQWLLFGRALVL